VTDAEIQTAALQLRAGGHAAVVVEVGATRGSVPRESGTRMVVAFDGVLGTVGGGHLELQAIAAARELLQRGGPAFERHMALGPSLGQCCGGALDLRYTPLADTDPASWTLTAPRFNLQLYGAGHVGRAVVALLANMPCTVQWIDERESEFPATPLPPHIARVCVEPVEAEVRSAPPNSCFLVLTHSHELDLAIAHAVLNRGDFAWFGLIGSKTKRSRFEHRLLERGIGAATLSHMVCPIGLPGIGGKEPGVLAVSVVAQLLQAL
jgi:xanthine dehydrogenase accessory factor